jgi:hypothetical protein
MSNLAEENLRLRDRVAELEGLPQCSFCAARAWAKCCNSGCKAFMCDEHGTHIGITHISMRNPKENVAFEHVICDRCNGEQTSKLTAVRDPKTDTDGAQSSRDVTEASERGEG